MSTIYKIATTCERVCSVFGEDRGSKLHAVHLAQFIHETHRNVDFYGLLLNQAQTWPAFVLQRKQITGIQALICNALQYG
jgi:hypothetical protein